MKRIVLLCSCLLVSVLIYHTWTKAIKAALRIPTVHYAKGRYATNQVIVKLKERPQITVYKAKLRSERAKSFVGKFVNAQEDVALKLNGQETPEDTLNHINRVKSESGVIQSQELFQTNNLNDARVKPLNGYVVYTTNGKEPLNSVIEKYAALAEVELVEPNYILKAQTYPNDTNYNASSHVQWNYDKINMPQAWEKSKGSNDVVVGILDSGIDKAHEDFAGRTIRTGRDYVTCDFLLSEDSCLVTKICPKSSQGYCDDDPNDDVGHGSHVAGIIGAVTNNNKGIAGMNWNVTLLPVKVINRTGVGLISWFADAFIYAADQGAKVINFSVGGCDSDATETDPCPHVHNTIQSETFKSAIDYAISKGVTIVVAAGNDDQDAQWYAPPDYNNTPGRPGKLIVVAATNPQDARSSYSNYGSLITIGAPGGNATTDRNHDGVIDSRDCINEECILSTVPGTKKYDAWDGTSMAAPHVAGLAALMLSLNPALTTSQIVDRLVQNGDTLTSTDAKSGFKRINAARVLEGLASTTSLTPSPSPTGPATTPTPTESPAAYCCAVRYPCTDGSNFSSYLKNHVDNRDKITRYGSGDCHQLAERTAIDNLEYADSQCASVHTIPNQCAPGLVTTTPSLTPTPTGITLGCPVRCPIGVPGRNLGNANCDATIDERDYVLWKQQLEVYQAGTTILKDNRTADFYCSEQDPSTQVIDMIDFEIWRRNAFPPPPPTPTPPPPSATPIPQVSITVTPTPTPTTVSVDWKGVPITIRTTFLATGQSLDGGASWPNILLFINNAGGFDGPMDYGRCDDLTPTPMPTGNHPTLCGTPPLYSDKLVDRFTVTGPSPFVKETTIKAGDLIYAPLFSYSPPYFHGDSKISYVFDNYFKYQTVYRELAITKIEFLAPDKSTFFEYFTPQTDSYYGGYAAYQGQKQSFYFDYGFVNANGYGQAFDRERMETIVQNKSHENNQWIFHDGGSFNIVTENLLPNLLLYLNRNQNPTPTVTPTVSMTPFPTVSAHLSGKIIYAAYVDEKNATSEVFIMNAGGNNIKNLTHDLGLPTVPSFTKDGSKMVFASAKNGKADIYIMNNDGTQLQQLTQGEGDNTNPSLSPDGSLIVFDSTRDNSPGIYPQDHTDIYLMKSDGTEVKRLTNTSRLKVAGHPIFSPDGQNIIFVSNKDLYGSIYRMNRDGSDATRLTNTPEGDGNPVFLPDGSKIIFTSGRPGNHNELYSMNPDGSNQTLLSSLEFDKEFPIVSPDGTKVLFLGNILALSPNSPYITPKLFVLDLLTSKVEQLNQDNTAKYALTQPTWIAGTP